MGEILEPCKSCSAECCKKFWVYMTVFDFMRVYNEIGEKAFEMVESREKRRVKGGWTPGFFVYDWNGNMKEYIVVIKRKKDGECVFLSGDGKCEAREFRPYACRAYPFTPSEEKGICEARPYLCERKWSEKEIKREGFRDVIEQQSREIRKYGKLARKWNIEKAKGGGGLREHIRFCIEIVENGN